MENFWDSSVWGTLNVVAALLGSLLVANMLKKFIKPLQASLIPTSVLGGLLLLGVSAIYKAVFETEMFNGELFGGDGTQTLEMLTYHCLALGFIASTFKTSDGKMTKQRSVEILNTGITTVSTYLLQAVVGLGITIVFAMFVKGFFSAAGISVAPTSPGGNSKCAAVDSGKQQAVYRLYNPVTSEHLFTTDSNEYRILAAKHGWKQEGIAWVGPNSKGSSVGVYRLYNAGLGDHHYTKDKKEAETLKKKFGWVYDNGGKPLFYSDDSCKRVPVYRQYNGGLTSGQHHYTADEKEAKALITKYGWKNEAIGWYAVKWR